MGRARRRAAVVVVAVMAALAVRCTAGPVPSASLGVHFLATPAAPGAELPGLVALPDGRLGLSWVESVGEARHALRIAIRAPGQPWAETRTVAEGQNWFVNWADFPAVAALPDGTLFAHWLAMRGDGKYTYDIQLARSLDGGVSWSESSVVHDDGVAAEHGFVAMAPVRGDRLGFLWLDGREAAGGHGHGGPMTLRYATFDRHGAKTDELRLDDRVCDCCQTALAGTEDGLIAAYRDRSDAEVRDVMVRRWSAGGWSDAQAVGGEGWTIAGCPVNGPALAADGRRVALAWFTNANETPRVKVALSSDAGGSWSAPVTVDEGKPLGRVDVALLADGSALVSWIEVVDAAAAVEVRRVAVDGTAGPVTRVATTSAAPASGFPRLERQGDSVVIAWTEAGESGGIRAAELSGW